MATTGERLKQIMKETGLKQVHIVRMAQPYCIKYGKKLDRNYISQYVNDKVEPKRDMISLLAEVLNVDDAWLAGFDVPQERKTPSLDLGQSEREKQLFDLFEKMSLAQQIDIIQLMEKKIVK